MMRFCIGLMVGIAIATAAGAHAMSVEEVLVRDAAIEHGVNQDWLAATVRCESGFNRYATNGQYWGMGQLGPWERARFVSRGYTDIWDPSQVANYMAERFSEGGSSAWECAGRR